MDYAYNMQKDTPIQVASELTERELEILRQIAGGASTKDIARQLFISPNTVKAFLRLVMVKMKVSTRSGIAGKIAGSSRANG